MKTCAAPLISVLLPTFNSNVEFLTSAICSVLKQTYPFWELCIVDDASSDNTTREVLEFFSKQDNRIKVTYRVLNGHISEASNSALELVTGDWVVLMDHDDLLSPNALQEIATVIQERPDLRLIYSDEDKTNDRNRRIDPYFKPSLNKDLFLSQNYFCHLMAAQRSVVTEVGGFRVGYEGSQDHDLALRVVEQVREDQIYHIPKILYHWRSHSESTASAGDAKPYTMKAGERAINDHLQRVGSPAHCSHDGQGGYRVRYPMPERMIGISGVILSDGKKDALGKCIRHLENISEILNIIVLPISYAAGHRISRMNLAEHILVLKYDTHRSLSSLLNGAVDFSQGDFLFFLHDGLDGVDQESLQEMISHAARFDIGAVGGKILYRSGRVRQAGLLLDSDKISCPAFHHYQGHSRGYMGRLTLIQNYSAVSKDCMVIEKRKFVEVRGFDEKHLAYHHLDVDLCIRLKNAGYRTLWTPYAKLTDSSPRFSPSKILGRYSPRSRKDKKWMQNRWGALLSNDPAYNSNLNQKKKDFSFKWSPKEA